uniref:Uncharacterized protein n=1 Tax=Nelumbo nucifera TaxID=4432 RepID=A0A822ZR03_NELNU|nr:TPA_asm: hypothetical protein HUJ06_004171 [Nelumbo nucifera]
MTSELRSLAIGDKLIEKLRGMGVNKDCLQLDNLIPPVTQINPRDVISVEDVRKLLRLS